MLTLLGSLASGGSSSSTAPGTLATAAGNDEKAKARTYIMPPPQAVACGATHSLYLAPGGGGGGDETRAGAGTRIFGWGGNRHNALGMPREEEEEGKKRRQQGPYKWDAVVPFPTEEVFCRQMLHTEDGARGRHTVRDLFEVACGSNHSVVLEKFDGASDLPQQQKPQQQHPQHDLVASRVWSCGFGANGQLGRGVIDEEDGETDLPVEVVLPSFPGSRVVVQRVCCGGDHTLAIANFVGLSAVSSSTCGRVFAWGLGNYGALGTGAWQDELAPKELWFPGDQYYGDDRPGMCDRNVSIVQVAAGSKHSLALGVDGAIFAWGHGGHGRLGLGSQAVGGGSTAVSYVTGNSPIQIRGIARMKYVAAGESHSAAVDQLGGLYTWGNGSHGRCGHGTSTDIDVPIRVEWSMGISVSQVALGLMHSLAVTAKGQLFAWGKGPATGLDAPNNAATPTPAPVELPDNLIVQQVATGPLHTVVLMTDGSICCFGSGSEGRMPSSTIDGESGFSRDQTFPMKLDDCKGLALDGQGLRDGKDNSSSPPPGQEDLREANPAWWPNHIFCGGACSAMLTNTASGDKGSLHVDENLWVWGSSTVTAGVDGGQDSGRDLWNPAILKRGFRSSIRMVALGLNHCLAVTGIMIYAWGDGSKGQLGTGNLSRCSQPQLLKHPKEVIVIAAGDEYSACIIQGGKAYTWGQADSGRLGLGRCLAEGFQLVPKQVQITDPRSEGEEVLLLQGIACGSEHTAFVTENSELLTCGAGWFGRLGLGSTDNAYIPEMVKLPAGVAVRDVLCGMYHTHVVDQSGTLWVSGRDSAICKTTVGHQLEFVPFEPFLEPRRSILSLATRDEHTLAVTTSPESEHGMELWVWGKNSCGQLGLPPDQVPRVDWPWQLSINGVECNGTRVRHRLVQVATGPKHSMCLILPRRPKSRKNAVSIARDPVIYAWGSIACGRLGLTHQQASSKLESQSREEQTPRSQQLQKSCGEHVCPPVPLYSAWKPAEEHAHKIREVHGKDSKDTVQGSVGACSGWLDAELKLWQESEENKKQRLVERKNDVETIYHGFLDEICKLWDKPEPGDESITEYHLRQKETRVEKEYLRTMKAVGLSGSGHMPRLQGRGETDVDIRCKLHYCEELLWVLQQQPLYLSRLAANFLGRRFDDKEVSLFIRVVTRLFDDLKTSRTRYLQNALFKLLIDGEMSRNLQLWELFDSRSLVTPLIQNMSTHPFFFEGIAMPILDPDDPTSLVSMLIRYTISRDGDTPRHFRTESKGTGPEVTGVVALSSLEYEEMVRKEMSVLHRKDAVVTHEARLRLRGVLQEEWGAFAHFCFKPPSESTAVRSKNHGALSGFITHFLKEVLQRDSSKNPGTRSVRTLLVAIFNAVVRHKGLESLLNDANNTEDPEQWLVDACLPSASVLLSSIIGAVLNALDTGPLALVRLKITRRATQMEHKLVDQWNQEQRILKHGRNDAGKGEAEINPMLTHRVLSNIKNLARFFLAAGSQDTAHIDGAMKECGDKLHVFTRRVLCDVLHGKRGVEDGGHANAKYQDMTETRLTADLYNSHFSFAQSVVRLSTVDILELTNLLWKYMEPSSRSADAVAVRINTPEEDRLYSLVHSILPRRKGSGKKGHSEVVPWDRDGYIWLAAQKQEWHNFRVKARFLEFARTGVEEPTFCEKSLAPIPRSLALPEQRRRHGVRAVKNLSQREDQRGPLVLTPDGESVCAYELLEDLLSMLAGHYKTHQSLKMSLSGTTYYDLIVELEFLAKKIMSNIEDGRADKSDETLLQRLEIGRHVVGKLREKGYTSPDFFVYLDSSMSRRERYTVYLQRIKEATQEVFRARTSYRSELKDRYMLLSQVALLSSTCELPAVIFGMAEQKSVYLTMLKARKKKLKARKDRPTPAQALYESLKGNSDDGKVPDEMMAMVDVPARSYTFKQLVGKGVIVRMHDKLEPRVRQKLVVNIQSKDEGYMVSICMKTTLLKEFFISRQDILRCESSHKIAEITYGDGFVDLNCFRLRRLLAWMSAEGGL